MMGGQESEASASQAKDPALPAKVDPKVRDVVLFFAYRNAFPIPSTRLMKLAYLTELRSIERWGRRFTHARFLNWHYGPYSPDVALAMEGVPELTMEVKQSSRGRGKFFRPSQDKVRVGLTKDELKLLESVREDWQRVDSESLIAATKQSPPFVWTSFGEEIPFAQYKGFVQRMHRVEQGKLGRTAQSLDDDEAIDQFVKRL